MYLDVGKGGDYLLFGGKIGALLEFEVTYRTRQGEVAVDAAKVDKATSSLDTRLFGCAVSAWSSDARGRRTFVLRLVVERERLGPAFYSQDSSRIARVGLSV